MRSSTASPSVPRAAATEAASAREPGTAKGTTRMGANSAWGGVEGGSSSTAMAITVQNRAWLCTTAPTSGRAR